MREVDEPSNVNARAEKALDPLSPSSEKGDLNVLLFGFALS